MDWTVYYKSTKVIGRLTATLPVIPSKGDFVGFGTDSYVVSSVQWHPSEFQIIVFLKEV